VSAGYKSPRLLRLRDFARRFRMPVHEEQGRSGFAKALPAKAIMPLQAPAGVQWSPKRAALMCVLLRWCTGSITHAQAPLRLQKGAAAIPSPLPCWLAWGFDFTLKVRGSVPTLLRGC